MNSRFRINTQNLIGLINHLSCAFFTFPTHNSSMIDYGRGMDAILGERSRNFY